MVWINDFASGGDIGMGGGVVDRDPCRASAPIASELLAVCLKSLIAFLVAHPFDTTCRIPP